MINIAGLDFPEKCVPKCPYNNQPFYQGSPCTRCPIFCCAPIEGEGWSLIAPEEFDPELAKQWYDFFEQLKQGNTMND